jgi:NAD(P)-dependent dehydrogenase (short-subunit alcohol dehydrogenase family)
MELNDKVAVVTGGASGIGRALALRFGEEGARGVVVGDLDGDGAVAVAAQMGEGRAVAVAGDVATEAGVDELVGAAEGTFGRVDLFCANAGVAVGADLGAPEEWDLSFAVNIDAHILAARRLLPGWLERGEGYFLTTASAAGLLTQIGSAPYAVTKHAAVGFAEWLSVTYGDRGVRVSCLCPMGVDTPLLREGLDSPEADGAALGPRVVRSAGDLLQPEQVADEVVDALAEERFLVLPHPEVLTFFRRKGDDYDRWLAGMRRLQRSMR